MKRLFSIIMVITLAAASFAGAYAEDKLQIVCTSFPCYDFARAVSGGEAEISMLIKPGSEVHSFEPTPADVLAVAQADLFVYIGGESDAWVEDILSSFGGDAPKTLRLFDCVEALEADHGHDHHEYDEHIWTAPSNAAAMIEALEDALSEIDPSHEENYYQNAMDYQDQICRLDSQIADIVENAVRREMIFADRFPFLYFAKEYGLEWHAAFPSCSAESEPSAKTIAELIGKVNADEIPVIYILELSSGKTAATIAEETGAEILVFHSMQNVSETDFTAGETYITLMQRNIEALRKGLN